MSFSSLDSGFAAPRPAGIPAQVSGTFGPNPGGIPSHISGTLPTRFTPAAPTVSDTIGAPPGAGGPIAPPQTLPGDYHGAPPPGWAAAAGVTPPPVTGAGATSGTGGVTFDVNTLLQQALQHLGYSQLDDSLNAARSQAVIKFGDPALASMGGFGIDPQAGDFARQNYLSGNADLARLDKQRDLNRQALINKLAGHGLLNSGDLGYGLNQAESSYGNSRYDLTQGYLKQLSDLLAQTLSQKQTLRSNVSNAILSQFGNLIKDPSKLAGIYG